jgi:hypothetical protein
MNILNNTSMYKACCLSASNWILGHRISFCYYHSFIQYLLFLEKIALAVFEVLLFMKSLVIVVVFEHTKSMF